MPSALFAGEARFDLTESGIRCPIRELSEDLVEQGLASALGRARHERGGTSGHRHGHRVRPLTGSFGPVEMSVPRAQLCACKARLEREAEAAAARQQAKIAARAAEEQASRKPRPERKPKPAAGRVDPKRVANPTDPDSRSRKTPCRWVQGCNVQAVVTPQQIILASVVTTEANDVRQLQPMLDQAQAMVERLRAEDAVLAAAAADAGFWSEENAASRTEDCALFLATRQDRKQRAEPREAASPRGRMPKGLSARQRLQRKLRTKRCRTIHARRSASSVEPVFDRMKDRQGAGQFSMRGLGACRGEWHLQAAVHNLRKLHRESVRRRAAGGRMDEKQENRA